MVVNVRVAVGLRRLTGGLAVVQAVGDTVGEAVFSLGRQFPDLKARLVDDDGQPVSHINIYVDGEHIRYRQGLDTALREGSEITLLPAAAGGGTPPSPFPERASAKRVRPDWPDFA